MGEPGWIARLRREAKVAEPAKAPKAPKALKPAKVAAALPPPPRDATAEVEALLAKVRPLVAHQSAVAAVENRQLLAAAHPGVPTQWPTLDTRRANSPQVSPLAAPVAPPTLFEAGDLPAVTAWGGDPQLLLSVPWQVRPALAAAPNQHAAYQLLETYGGPEGAMMAELHAQPGGPLYGVVAEYERKLHIYAASQAQALWDAEQRAEIGRRLAEAHTPPSSAQKSLMTKVQAARRERLGGD